MPIYEYCCRECGEKIEVLHRRRNEPAPVCKGCGEDALERLISRTHFQLKGDGWYVTDYANKGSGGGDSGGSGEGDSGDSGGGDSGEGASSSDSTSSGSDSTSSGTDSTSSTSSSASTASSADSGA